MNKYQVNTPRKKVSKDVGKGGNAHEYCTAALRHLRLQGLWHPLTVAVPVALTYIL